MRVVLAHLSGPNPGPVELPPQVKFALGLGDQGRDGDGRQVMGFPPRDFYSVLETSFRWECNGDAPDESTIRKKIRGFWGRLRPD